MPFHKRRQEIAPIASINLTSLLDVTFVLLLAFMIVAPTLKTGIKIDLPEVKDSPPLTPRKSHTITLQKQDDPQDPVWFYLDNKRLTSEELRRGLEQLHSRDAEQLDVIIETDRTVPCEALLRVLAMTDTIGIKSVGVLTEPEKK